VEIVTAAADVMRTRENEISRVAFAKSDASLVAFADWLRFGDSTTASLGRRPHASLRVCGLLRLTVRGETPMRRGTFIITLACSLSSGLLTALSMVTLASEVDILASVRIMHAVTAGGTPLPAGTYEIRLAGDGPAPLVGQSRDAQRWVEFVAHDLVVAREVAEVLHDDDVTSVGASAVPVRSGTRVELLKGGEFVRISVRRERERYLVHLPVAR
jgi:hypothetical protein